MRGRLRRLSMLVALGATCAGMPVVPRAAVEAAVPGLNGLLATDSDSNIWTVTSEGNDPRMVVSGPSTEFEPSFSPDGTKIAFASDRSGTGFEIWVAAADGSNPRQLTLNGLIDRWPVWSPDGRTIVADRHDGSHWQLWAMDSSNGANQRALTAEAESSFHASYSPDGTKIAYSRNGHLVVMNPDGTGKDVKQPASWCGKHIDWSPDGSKLAFQDCSGHVAISNPDGTQVRLLSGSGGDAPSWSPDGGFIAFVDHSSWGPYPPAVARTDGSGGITKLSQPAGSALRVSWQPIASIARILVTETGGSTTVTEGGDPDTYSLALSTRPSAPVRLLIAGDGQVETSHAEVVFGPSDWSSPRTVSVHAIDDGLYEVPAISLLVHTASSQDPAYDGMDAVVSVRVLDDDDRWQYFALGDGVASGYGLRHAGPCAVSEGSYPRLVAASLAAERTIEALEFACEGTRALGTTTSVMRDLSKQVGRVLDHRNPVALALVSISIGFGDLDLTDAASQREVLCTMGDQTFGGFLDDRSKRLGDAVLAQAQRLLVGDPRVVVALLELYQPLNTSPSHLDDPFVVGGVEAPCDIERARQRAEDLVDAVNGAFHRIRDSLPIDAQPRMRIGFARTLFEGREGGSPGCGTGHPTDVDTFIQHPSRGYTSARGGDCLHPNERGARALADAVLSAGDVPSADLTPPETQLFTADGSIILGVPGFEGHVAGQSTDAGAGVSTVLVTFTPDLGAPSTTGVRCTAAARPICRWSVPPPLVAGRYQVSARAVDRAGNREASPKLATILVV